MNPFVLLYSILINFLALGLYMLFNVLALTMHVLFWYLLPATAVALILFTLGRSLFLLLRKFSHRRPV